MSISGQWDIAVDTPMGVQKSVLTLQADGETLTGDQQSQFGSTPLKNGAVNGDRLSWTLQPMIPFPMTLEFEAAIDGDTISGTVTTPMGSSRLSGSRKT